VSAHSQIALAVEALPLPVDDAGRRWTIRGATAAWLLTQGSDHTRRAYYRDLALWLVWCDQAGLDPRRALRADVDLWRATLTGTSSTIARRLASVSSWYRYLISNDAAGNNPVGAVRRPKVDKDSSPTVGLSAQEAAALMRTARAETGPTARRTTALLGLLVGTGMRVGEAIGLDLDSIRHNRGHRTVRILGKGNKVREIPIPPALGRDLDAYLAERSAAVGAPVGVDPDSPSGHLFVTATGRRLDQPAVFRTLRRIADRAGIDAAPLLSPHSLRHTAITAALAVAPLHRVQGMAGHADPRTTLRYDQDRGSLDDSPAYWITELLG
jgi:site-specific recombinase XerD